MGEFGRVHLSPTHLSYDSLEPFVTLNRGPGHSCVPFEVERDSVEAVKSGDLVAGSYDISKDSEERFVLFLYFFFYNFLSSTLMSLSYIGSDWFICPTTSVER